MQGIDQHIEFFRDDQSAGSRCLRNRASRSTVTSHRAAYQRRQPSEADLGLALQELVMMRKG
jgi:hypothetical protein